MFKQIIVVLLLSLNLSTRTCEGTSKPNYKITTVVKEKDMLSTPLHEDATQTKSPFDEMVSRISSEGTSVASDEDYNFPNSTVKTGGCCSLS